jgi:uroporphyrinogen decarboxylase
MDNKERIRALIMNQPIDRVPFISYFLGFLAVSSDISLDDFFSRPEVAFRAGLETMEKLPWAGVRPAYDWADHGAWEFGGRIAWPRSDGNMTPYTPEPLVSSPDEVDRLPDPDPKETEWFSLLNRFNELCAQNGFTVQLPSTSIMSPLSSILGGPNLMKWIIKYPESVQRLAGKVVRFYKKAARSIIDRYGARCCSVNTQVPLESNNVISSEVFEEFCLPHIAELQGMYTESGVLATMVHLCGDHKQNLAHWKKVPFPDRTIFSIGDDMDLKETGDTLGEKYILAGNMSTTVIQVGTAEQVKGEVRRCLAQAKERPGGFILMPACEWPPLAPLENLEAVRQALMENGFY